MTCNCTDPRDTYFSQHAAKTARGFKKKGLDAPQRMIHRVLTGMEIGRWTVLEIGCGVGGLHLELLKSGCPSVYGIDISEGMIEQARRLAEELRLEDKVTYRVGDLSALREVLPEADVVVMDKVLCCDPNPGALIRDAVAKTRSVLVVSYPREGVLARLSFSFSAWMGRILRWSFHPFYHDPAMLHAAILAEGFSEVHAAATPIWQVGIFRREH